MNDSERSLLREALKGGRIVEVIDEWSKIIQYGVVVGNIVSYIYPGGYDDIDSLVNEEEDIYYVNRVLELKHDAKMYINIEKEFNLHEDDYNVVYTKKKELTLQEINYDVEYLMIDNGRTRYIVKIKLNGVDYIISRRDKLSAYIIIDPVEKFEKENYAIYESEGCPYYPN